MIRNSIPVPNFQFLFSNYSSLVTLCLCACVPSAFVVRAQDKSCGTFLILNFQFLIPLPVWSSSGGASKTIAPDIFVPSVPTPQRAFV